jgi:hypothetical protein
MPAKNWKTTLGGVATILGGGAAVIHGVLASPLDTTAIMGGVTAIGTGIALLFAKDFNVTNASRPSESKSTPPE